MQKIKNKIKKNKLAFAKGSILAYSLIVMFMMVAIAASLSITTILEKKAASATEFSAQAFQVADSGVQLALKRVNAEIAKPYPGTIAKAFTDSSSGIVYCSGATSNGVGLDQIVANGSIYTLTFLKTDGVTPLQCSDPINLVGEIKSTGQYRGTVRSVSVKVAVKNPLVTLGDISGALKKYHDACGSYPVSSGWQGYCSAYGASLGLNWIPELTTAGFAIGILPIDPRNNGSCWNNTAQYIYSSNGTDYKLISHVPASMPTDPALIDPVRPTWAWGYWSAGGVNF